MRKILLYTGLLLMAISCKKVNLDGLAFPSEKLDAYEFENYNAGDESVPAEYDVTEVNRTLITLNSVDKKTGESFKIYGVYIGDMTTIAADTVIMYCHGQAQHMDLYWPRATLLASITEKHNYGVFMMDYRGYGMSEGKSSEQGLYEDVDASIDWLKDHGANPSRTFYYGFSLGCIPIIDRAAYRTDFQPAKVILESPLASVENLVHSSLILNVDPTFTSTLEFDNAEKIKAISAPLLWFHGVIDDYVAIQNGELIYTNYDGIYKEAARIEGANHGDIPKTMGYTSYLSQIEIFMKLVH